jgi:hypothetical protein
MWAPATAAGRADADDRRDPTKPPQVTRTRTPSRSPMSAPGNGECGGRPLSAPASALFSAPVGAAFRVLPRVLCRVRSWGPTSTFLGNVAENMTVCRSGRAFCGNGSIIARRSGSWPKLEHSSPFQPASQACT